MLDVCSGAGASALPAAAAVGPAGLVHAVDLADDLLEEGRRVASDRALQNVDSWSPTRPSGSRRARCPTPATTPWHAYGVFFLAGHGPSSNRLVHLVRPGGKVGVAVWRAAR